MAILLPVLPGVAQAREEPEGDRPEVPFLFAPPERRIAAPEARQGVASDGRHVFAIDNSTIARYDIASGDRIASFQGDAANFPHLNSCTMADAGLVCASSNYPAVPHQGTVEFFDLESLRHVRSAPLAENPGSLTVLTRHGGFWWAVFAHYDGKGGVDGQDHRATLLARLDDDFTILQRWKLPAKVLARLAPYSISGASWGADGRLYASGHDKPEIYVLEIPAEGGELHHAATIALASFGQAIDFDPRDPQLLWSIDRHSRTVLANRIPSLSRLPVPGPSSEE